VQQLKGFFRRFFERTLSRQLPADTTVIGSWQPGPTVTSAPQVFATHADGIDAYLVLILYLAITNAAMIAALIWIALHHAR